MTEPLTFIRYELDEQTKEELQPPCSWKRVRVETMQQYDHCSEPAICVVLISCRNCDRQVHVLSCGRHVGNWLAETSFCRGCMTIAGEVVSVEPLR